MLLVISPAKTLDFETPLPTTEHSQPGWLDHSQELIDQLKQLPPDAIASLMKISDKLAITNAARYESWQRPFTPDNARQAVLAFKGDVYTGLDAYNFSKPNFKFAQQHLRILSGLYGLLQPLDLIQPYRLEMGTRLENKRGKDLYSFWGKRLTEALNKEMEVSGNNTLINLASNEYFKAINPKQLKGDIITPVFKDMKNGKYKIISFYAKKARGLMARYIIQNKIKNKEKIKSFDLDGYQFSPELSKDNEWVFTRG